jgi:arylsulfatase
MAARAMEVFAAMLDHADYEFGRIIEALKQTGELDNTIIIAVSDNGTSAEGGLAGSFNELLMGQVDWAENLQHFDNWGGPDTYPHYPVGWAAAGNTPFRYYKQSAHEGGTRVPMLMSWPKGIARQGELRNQFHHVNDIVPTLLDLIGIAPPEEVDGVKQQPMDGISFRYTFDDERVATRKQVQYFELWGNHGIWADGWKAEVLARDKPWDVFTRVDYENPVWELYHVAEDFNERINVAEKYPEKLKELQKLFEQQAIKNNVYPIGPDFMQEKIAFMQKVLRDNNGRFNYYEGTARINNEQAPPINLMPFTLAATLATSDKRDGVIFALGGAEGGFALYIKDNKPAFAYNFLGRGVTTIASDDALPDGAVEITLSLDRQSPTAGNVVIGINGKNVAQGLLENLGTRFPTHETLDIGHDSGSHVSKDYRDSAVMAKGVINQVDFQMVQP